MPEFTPRARNAAEFGALMGRMATARADAPPAPAYEPRPDDVIITPYGKCGTTMLQQMFHQLRTGGDMDFDDISRVVPWIETAPALGIDINAPQRANPRGFKSHLDYESLPRGARYVVSLRDPGDAFVSMLRFMEGWFIEPGALTMEEFFEGWVTGGGPGGKGYWPHLLSWWAQRDNPDVLILTYRGLTADRAGHIRRLAEFAGIPADDALVDLVLERTSLAYMLEHKDRFDDAMMRARSESSLGLPPGADSAKVRVGGRHSGELPRALAERLDAIWAEQVAPVTGHASFAALEEELSGTRPPVQLPPIPA